MNAITDGTSDAAAVDMDEEMDIHVLFAKLVAKRWWIIGATALVAAALIVLVFVMTPVYRASTVLVPAGSERGPGGSGGSLGQLSGLASLAGLNVGGDEETEEALAVLDSRQFTETFLLEKNLIPRLFADRWDESAGQWRADSGSIPTPAKAYKLFDRKIRSIIRDKKTGLVTLQIDWTDRNEAADWANELVQRVNREMRSRAIARAEAYVQYLERELQSTSVVETRQAISRLIEAQIKQRMLANVTQEYAFRVVDKALPSDSDDPLRPKKLRLVAIGTFLGFILAVIGALSWIGVRSSSMRSRRVGNEFV